MDRMDYVGKYVITTKTPGWEYDNDILIRNYYDGGLHGMLVNHAGGVYLLSDLKCEDGTITFTASEKKLTTEWCLQLDGGAVSGTFTLKKDGEEPVTESVSGVKTEITPADDGADKDRRKKKALIIYSSITGNTEKVANWFREEFEFHDMEVTMLKMTTRVKWEDFVGKTYIEDYDVVCMGSMIIGGLPPKGMLNEGQNRQGGMDLEEGITKNAEAGLKFNANGAGGAAGRGMKDDEGKFNFIEAGRPRWHRDDYPTCSFPGGPDPHGLFYPLGIVFTTYGGGFKGPIEALPILELLKLKLEAKGCKVIGKFACCGKEYGPAGLDDGETPLGIDEPPVFYKDADGEYHAGSFFWHAHSNSRPNHDDEVVAKAFIKRIVEDHFYTADGARRDLISEYISYC